MEWTFLNEKMKTRMTLSLMDSPIIKPLNEDSHSVNPLIEQHVGLTAKYTGFADHLADTTVTDVIPFPSSGRRRLILRLIGWLQWVLTANLQCWPQLLKPHATDIRVLQEVFEPVHVLPHFDVGCVVTTGQASTVLHYAIERVQNFWLARLYTLNEQRTFE